MKKRGGLIGLEELTEAVLCRGEDGDQLRFATELVAFFSTLQVWKDAGLRLQRDGTVRNGDTRFLIRRLAGLVQKVAAAAADERHGDDLWSIEREHLKQTLRETYAAEFGDPPLTTVSDAMLDALLVITGPKWSQNHRLKSCHRDERAHCSMSAQKKGRKAPSEWSPLFLFSNHFCFDLFR